MIPIQEILTRSAHAAVSEASAGALHKKQVDILVLLMHSRWG